MNDSNVQGYKVFFLLFFFQPGIQDGSQTEPQLIHSLSVLPILGSGDTSIC